MSKRPELVLSGLELGPVIITFDCRPAPETGVARDIRTPRPMAPIRASHGRCAASRRVQFPPRQQSVRNPLNIDDRQARATIGRNRNEPPRARLRAARRVASERERRHSTVAAGARLQRNGRRASALQKAICKRTARGGLKHAGGAARALEASTREHPARARLELNRKVRAALGRE